MKKIGAVLLVAGVVMFLTVPAWGTQPDPNHRVTICHRTDSVTNPYVVITVDEAAVNMDTGDDHGQGDHNAEHRGPIASSEEVARQLKDAHTEWGDIIPPFYADGASGYWPSLNWNAAGQAMFENDCAYVMPSPSSSLSVSPSPSVSPTEVSIGPTTSPSVLETTVKPPKKTHSGGPSVLAFTGPGSPSVPLIATAMLFLLLGTTLLLWSKRTS